MQNYVRLSQAERQLIGVWKNQKISHKEIGRRLNRPTSTISREVTRNRWGKFEYEPLHAQAQTRKRLMVKSCGKHPLKNPQVYAYVLKRLGWGGSPEQIVGRMKLKHPHDPTWQICHETIYQFIYHPDHVAKKWWEYLRRKQVKRRSGVRRKAHRVHIPDRISIHQRPQVVADRKQFGHWEGDSIVGKGHRSGLHTSYERVASFTRIVKMKQITADESVMAQKTIYGALPHHARRSLTLDNGSENSKQTELKPLITTYHADPYSSWQRGGSENANLWIRYYFPKGTDFNRISDQEIHMVEWELNHRPRKRLNYHTPQEIFEHYLQKGCTSI